MEKRDVSTQMTELRSAFRGRLDEKDFFFIENLLMQAWDDGSFWAEERDK